MEQFLSAGTRVIEWLQVARVARAVRRRNIAFTVPLVFEAAFHLHVGELRHDRASLLVRGQAAEADHG